MSQANSFKKQQKSLLEILDMVAISADSDISPEEIYELRSSNQELGKFWSVDLKNMLKSYPTLFSTDLQIKQLGSDEWAQMFSHPLFQRRSPEVVPGKLDPVVGGFMLRIEGEVFGPVNEQEIEEKLTDHTLLFTDTISTDGGKTWTQICKCDVFDRRKRVAEQLPPSPESDIFALSQFEAMTNLIEKKDDEQKQCLNVIAGLAYVGQVHNGKIIAEEDHQIDDEKNLKFPVAPEIKEKKEGFINFTKIFQKKNVLISMMSFSVILIGMIWVLANNDSETKRTPATYVKKVNKVYKPKAHKIQRSKIAAQIINKQDNVRARRALRKSKKSFLESDTYKDPYYGENEDSLDDSEYENVEQDPIQASLSKNIIDPEDREQQDFDEDSALSEGPDSEADLFNEEFSE